MSETYNWVYADYRNNIWKFSKKDNKNLSYKIMYSEGKWTKEILIDIEVLDFSIYIDENEDIHLIYSNTKGELKYCTMKDKQWVGKTIYKVESNKFEIKNIKIKMLGNEMNIFYLLIEKDGSDHGILMQCMWTGERIKFTRVQDIILIPNLKDYYSVHINNNYLIDLFFITDEGDEVSLNHQNFENYIWSPRKRLYGIQGEDIEFEALINKDELHILNKSKENEIYSLDYVFINSAGVIKHERVCESKNKLEWPIFFIEDNNLICSWIEEKGILFSIFNGDTWERPLYINKNNKSELEAVNIFSYSHEEYIKEERVYINRELDLYLFNPKSFFVKDKISVENIINDSASTERVDERRVIDKLKFELSKVNAENKNLVNKINLLNREIKNSQRAMKEQDEKISSLLEKSLEVEARQDDLLKKVSKEKAKVVQELLEEKSRNEAIEFKLKDLEAEKMGINGELKSVEREKYDFIEENNNLKMEVENQMKKNIKLEKEVKGIYKENKILEIDINNIREKKINLDKEISKLKEMNRELNELNLKLNKENIKLNEGNIKLNEEKNKFHKDSQVISEIKLKLDKENERIVKINEKLMEEKERLIEEKEKLMEEKEILIEEKIALVKENEKINEELELERNQSVMDRLLRRRINY